MKLHTLLTTARTCLMASTVSCRSRSCFHLAIMIRRNFGRSSTWLASGFVTKKPRKQRGNPAVVIELFIFTAVICYFVPEIGTQVFVFGCRCLDSQIWRSRISTATELKLYSTCILPIFLYGSECWAVTEKDVQKMETVDLWCLRRLLGIKRYQFVSSAEVRQRTIQSLLTSTVQSRHLSLFRHLARMEDNINAEKILVALPVEH